MFTSVVPHSPLYLTATRRTPSSLPLSPDRTFLRSKKKYVARVALCAINVLMNAMALQNTFNINPADLLVRAIDFLLRIIFFCDHLRPPRQNTSSHPHSIPSVFPLDCLETHQSSAPSGTKAVLQTPVRPSRSAASGIDLTSVPRNGANTQVHPDRSCPKSSFHPPPSSCVPNPRPLL